MAEEHKKKKHHGFKHTHIEHHNDGSATVHHQHENPEHDVKHAVGNLDEMHDSMQQHLGQPNPGEAEANAGDHGVPAAEAGAAGLPALGAAGPAGA